MAVNLHNLIDIDLLAYFKSKLDLLFANKVDKETGKGLSSNDYTGAEKTKLSGIAAGAQVNVLEGVQVAGTTISPTNKIVNIPAATTSAAGAMSAADKTKLNGIATGAQVNVIETVKVNGTALSVTSKAVDVPVPTTVAELTDADDYATKDYVTTNGGKIDKIKVNGTEQSIDATDKSVNISVPTAATTAPVMDGTAAVGSATTWAKADHVHPSDTTKVDKVSGKGLSTNDFTGSYKSKLDGIEAGAQVNVVETIKVNGLEVAETEVGSKTFDISVPLPATTTPLMDGTAAVGSATKWAKADHVHPTDTSRAAASDLTSHTGNTTVHITAEERTAWNAKVDSADIPDGSDDNPLMDGTAAPGASTSWSRSDHVHPSDSTKVDKITGKGLSTNDYTTADMNKLAGIAAGAQVNVVTNASSSGSGAAETMTVAKGSTNYTTYTKAALDTSLGLKADASSVYTKTEIDQKMVGAMNYKGTKATVAALPSSGNAQGDVWHVTADGGEYAWNGSAWEELGTAVDLSGYVEDSDLGLATTEDIDALFT